MAGFPGLREKRPVKNVKKLRAPIIIIKILISIIKNFYTQSVFRSIFKFYFNYFALLLKYLILCVGD